MNARSFLVPCAVLLLGATPALAAFDPSAWESQQSFELDVTGPVRVIVPAAIRAAARPDAADLRLLGPDGKEVAFALLNAIDDAPPPPARIAVEATTRIEHDKTIIDFRLPAPTDVASIHLRSAASQFLKAASVRWLDGADGTPAEAIVFREPGQAEELSIRTAAVRVMRGQVIILDDRAAPIPITVEAVQPARAPDWGPRGVPPSTLRVRAESSAGRTRLLLNLGTRHQRVAFVGLDREDAVYHRQVSIQQRALENDNVVEREIARGWIRRAVFDAGDSRFRYSDLSGVPTNFIAPSEEIEVWVEDGDSPPVVWNVRVEVAPEYVAFLCGATGRYTFLAGNAAARAPRYDVNAFRGQWLKTPLAAIEPGAVTRTAGFRARETPLDVPELAGAFVPEGWRHQKTVTIHEAGAQALELDLGVLAKCSENLDDLRLVRDGRQVPYLIERSSRERADPVKFVAAPDPARPPVGRWKLELPVVGPPYRNLRLTTDEKLFDRRVTLIEVLAGQGTERALRVSRSWTRRSAEDPTGLTIPIENASQVASLILEIDHGDNTPFAPKTIEITHAISRLRFRASQPGELTLHFSNSDARAPSYDLQLVADQLLNAPEIRSDFILDIESRPVDGTALGGRVPVRQLIFWGSLVLVVGVLLVVVAKLLPKPPEAKK